jgi:hypothetical protein
VADVRKVGDDEYEISPHRTGVGGAAPAPPAAPAPVPAAAAETGSTPARPVAGEPAGAIRENGQRSGVRFRRGSRSPLRAGEVPLIGVVEVDGPAPIVPLVEEMPGTPPDAPGKPARPRRAPRKRAPAGSEAPAPPGPTEAPPPKRPRPRARKKPAE